MSWNKQTWHDATQAAIEGKCGDADGEAFGDLFYMWGEHMGENGTDQHDNYLDAFDAFADDVSNGVEELGMESTRRSR